MTSSIATRLLSQLTADLTRCVDVPSILRVTGSFLYDVVPCNFGHLSVVIDGSVIESTFGDWDKRPDHSPHFSLAEGRLHLGAEALEIPYFLSHISKNSPQSLVTILLKKFGFVSTAVFPIGNARHRMGWCELYFKRRKAHWRPAEIKLLTECLETVSIHLQRVTFQVLAEDSKSQSVRVVENEARFERLAEHGNMLMIRTDKRLKITEVAGNIDRILGVTPEELKNNPSIWRKFIPIDDLRALLKSLELRRGGVGAHVSEEVSVINKRTGQTHWLLVKAIVLHDAAAEFTGIEGFALDITDKRRALDELVTEQRRLQALYEVSRAAYGASDPVFVSLKGLRALLRATASHAGFVCFYEPESSVLEIIASDGLSESFVSRAQEYINGQSVVRKATLEKRFIMVDTVQDTESSMPDFAREEGVQAAVAMPLIVDDVVLGSFVLFSREPARYSPADEQLIVAASMQMAKGIKQAEFFAAEKKQSTSLAALYRLTHQLSRRITPREIAQHAFPVIQEEIHCKRMWLGVINESATHLVGQAGFGPGVRRHIIDIQIELALPHDVIDQALRTKEPVVVEPNRKLNCSGLQRIVEILKPSAFVVLPLIAVGQVVGILLIEPAVPSVVFAQKKLPLLMNMAAEIGSVILARRYEAKMAEADKMRMAGGLAAGVAHNFNNLLQAVMGQASLIEMQVPKDSALHRSANMIVDAAGKGAALIKQLLNLSMTGNTIRQSVSLGELLKDSEDLYKSLLGKEIFFDSQIRSDCPVVVADQRQLQQVISNLLLNAKEAIGIRAGGKVTLRAVTVSVRSGEVDPELAPGRYARIDIEDNGAGMDTESLARCFEPFYTTKTVDQTTGVGFGGTGLGLSSAYSILKQHDGLIGVRSVMGQGTVFHLYIPAASQIRNSSASSDTSKSTAHVVVAGLADAQVEKVREFTQSRKLLVKNVDTDESVIEAIERVGEDLQLLVLDIDRLPLEPTEVVRRALGSQATLEVILVSHAVERSRKKFLEFPRVRLTTLSALQTAVEEVLKGADPLGLLRTDDSSLISRIEMEKIPLSGGTTITSTGPSEGQSSSLKIGRRDNAGEEKKK